MMMIMMAMGTEQPEWRVALVPGNIEGVSFAELYIELYGKRQRIGTLSAFNFPRSGTHTSTWSTRRNDGKTTNKYGLEKKKHKIQTMKTKTSREAICF